MNDLISLFRPSDEAPAVQVRQGVVDSWDGATGNNSIRVAGGVLLNVPALKAGSATLAEGDVVNLLSVGNQWFLLGNVTTPGDPGTVPTWNVDITALTGQVETIQTVTIPAVQGDVTVVQGQVIDLGTDVATAQSTAEGAVTDAANAQGTADSAVSAASAAASAASTAQAGVDALQTELDAAEADVAAAQADIATLTGTTLPGLAADIAAAQAEVDVILPIGTTKISDDAITTAKIAAGQITAVKIAADTITAAQIAASAITASELAANAVTAGKIAAGTIVAADIASGTITATQIAANTITAAKIAAGTITATEIQAGAITGSKLSADAIDGKTITGALFRTMASGQRLEIDSASAANELRFYSGAASETTPGRIYSDLVSGGSYLNLASPLTSVAPATDSAELQLNKFSSGVTNAMLAAWNTQIIAENNNRIQAGTHELQLNSAGLLDLDGDEIISQNATQTLTNKNLSSATNTFPSIPYSVAVSGTTDASGFLTVTHGAGFTPVGGWWTCTNPGASFAAFWGIDTIGATTCRLRFFNVNTGQLTVATAVQGRLFLVKS